MGLLGLLAPTPDPNPDPTPWGGNNRYDVIVEDSDLTRLGVLQSALCTEVEEVLNDQGHQTLTYSAHDKNIGTLQDTDGSLIVLKRNITTYMNGVVIMRSPHVDWELAPNGDITPELPDQWWWFLAKRFFGQANNPTFLPNTEWVWPDGHSHPDNWYNANCAPVREANSLDSGYQVRIPPPVDYGPGAYIGSTLSLDPILFSGGFPYVVTAYFKLDQTLAGPATFFDGRVMELFLYSDEAHLLDGDDAGRYAWADITDASPPDLDGWQEVHCVIVLPNSTIMPTPILDVHLMAGMVDGDGLNGNVTWAGAPLYPTLTRDETFASFEQGSDVATLAQWAIQGAQDPLLGKSDLGIGTDCATGHAGTIGLSEPLNRHRMVGELIQKELCAIDGGIDARFDYTPTTTTFTTGREEGARFQYHQSDLPLRQGRGWLSLTVKRKGSEASTDVVERGDNTGFYCYAGSASDRSGTDGIVLDEVNQAASGTLPRNLNFTAKRRLDLTKIPPYEIEGVLPAGYWLDGPASRLGGGRAVRCGDTFDSQHFVGPVNACPGIHRVSRRKLNPQADTMTVTLQPIDFGRDLADDLSGLRRNVNVLDRRPALSSGNVVSVPATSAGLTFTGDGSGAVDWSGGTLGVARANGVYVAVGTSGAWQGHIQAGALSLEGIVAVTGCRLIAFSVTGVSLDFMLQVDRPGALFQFENFSATTGVLTLVLIQPSKLTL